MNVVKPGLVRVEADEVTYNLHILLRFDIERALIRDDLAVADLARQAGFGEVTVWGDHLLTPHGAGSHRAILEARLV